VRLQYAGPVAVFRIAALAAIGLLAWAADNPDELYREGLRLLSEQKVEAAIAAFQKTVALRPRDAAAWKALGVGFASRGDYESAEKPFHSACLFQPLLADACLYYGRTLYLLDRFEPALNVLRKAQENDRQNAQIRRIEGLSLEALGREQESEAAFREAMRLDRGSAPNDDPGIDYGVFLFRRGRAEDALRPLEAALQKHSDAGRAHLELGCVLLALDRVQEAVPHLERAVALDPQAPRGHLLLGRAYLRLGKAELAEQHLAQGSRTVR